MAAADTSARALAMWSAVGQAFGKMLWLFVPVPTPRLLRLAWRSRGLCLAAFCAALGRLLWRKKLRRYASYVRISAPLRGAGVKYGQLAPQQSWYRSWWSRRWYRWSNPFSLSCHWTAACPCCKRPLEISLAPAATAPQVAAEAKGKYAYLICLWGGSVEYVLGAMVLGASIRKTGSKHDRVCLFTEDVPREHIQRLSQLWQCRRMEHVEACMEQLSFPDREERFANVFTKLRGLGLTEYEKVLMMDIDLLVRQNIDDLFDLPAPAALRRGMNDWGTLRHGQPVDGSSFLLGEDKSQPRWSWGQGTGINAGVMLWQPNQQVLDEMLAELCEPNHPEHVRGNGPEQDYLSRHWADAPWTYIGAEYNFQLHQMFFALHPDRAQYAERARLLEHPEKIKIVHYSGKPTAKPWNRVLAAGAGSHYLPDRSQDEEYVKLFAEEFMGYWLWIRRDREKFQMQAEGNTWDMVNLELAEDGEYYRRERDGTRTHLPIPAARKEGAMKLLRDVLQEWFDLYEYLESEFGFFLASLPRVPSTGYALRRPFVGSVATSTALKRTTWKRSGSQAWWMEAEKVLPKSNQRKFPGDLQKITAFCSIENGTASVSLRDPENTFEEEGPEVSGLYIKNLGPTAARTFSTEDLSPEGLFPVHLWVSTIPEGEIILMALVGITGDIRPLLQALAPLGVPQDLPPPHCRVLACVSIAANVSADRRLCGNHAAPDVAYASLLVDPERL